MATTSPATLVDVEAGLLTGALLSLYATTVAVCDNTGAVTGDA
jgi:hypothetical protein